MMNRILFSVCFAFSVIVGFTQIPSYKFFLNDSAKVVTDTFTVKYNASFIYSSYNLIDSIVVKREKMKSRNSYSYNQKVFKQTINPVNCSAYSLDEKPDSYGNIIQQIVVKNITSSSFGFDVNYSLSNQTLLKPFNDCVYDSTIYKTFNDSIKKYTLPTIDIQSTNQEIKALAQEIVKGCVTTSDIVQAAILWNRNNVSYDFTLNQSNQDAVNVLHNKTAICVGFSNFTCAILRSLGIAARTVGGIKIESGTIRYSYEGNKYSFSKGAEAHSWIEVYYPSINKWISSEPQGKANFIFPDYVSELTDLQSSGIYTHIYSSQHVSGTYQYSFASETSDTLYNYNMSVLRTETIPQNIRTFNPYFCLNVGINKDCSSTVQLPGNALTISGKNDVCQEIIGEVYTVPTINNATSYIWTLPDGTLKTTNANTLSIDINGFPTSGVLKVKGHNDFGDGAENSIPIRVKSLPIKYTITGNSEICSNQGTAMYTINNTTDSPKWSVLPGTTSTFSTGSLTMKLSSLTKSGTIQVYGNNSCGDGPLSTFAITVGSKTAKPILKDSSFVMCDNASALPTFVVTNPVGTITWIDKGITKTGNSFMPQKPTIDNKAIILVTQSANSCGNSDTVKAVLTVFKKTAAPELVSGSLTGCCYVPVLILKNVAKNDSVQWFLNDSPLNIKNIPLTSFQPKVIGNYKVSVTDSLGCFTQTSNVVTILVLDVSEFDIQNIKMSPNPTKGLLNVSGDVLTNATIEVYNWIGVLMQSTKSSTDNVSIDMSDYANGVYSVIVRNAYGQWTGKVVKE